MSLWTLKLPAAVIHILAFLFQIIDFKKNHNQRSSKQLPSTNPPITELILVNNVESYSNSTAAALYFKED